MWVFGLVLGILGKREGCVGVCLIRKAGGKEMVS